MRYLVICCVVFCALDADAQTTPPRQPYRVEAHVEAGPLISYFVRDRHLPEGSRLTVGYDALLRVLWHPDHRLSVGLLVGHLLLISERFTVSDGTTIRGTLTTYPIMIDESMQAFGFEGGVALGIHVIRTHLEDNGVSDGTRLELGSIAHGGYHIRIGNGFKLGPEMLMNYMPYRGILSFAPQLDLKYDLLTY
jgi:hypothetical protein